MEARSIPAGVVPMARAEAREATVAVPWPLVATVFAATSILVGLLWDISWHMSIGRDTFWTPAHMGIYIGGVVGGCANGFLVLQTTFAGTPDARARSVRIWGFRGPLGSWIAIWGAGAMITSAPFDDWWHNAYGLDVQVLSVPHVVLMFGILGIVIGAAITALTAQNRAEHDAATTARAPLFRAIYAYAAGVVLTISYVGVWQDMHPAYMHHSHYYAAAAYPLPLILAMSMRSLHLRWPATTVALLYMLLFGAMTWILPLFPATPKLGPIWQPITHMVPMGFPALLVAPAVAFDLVNHRFGHRNRWLLALGLGALFVVTLAAVTWPFGTFMMSTASHNWFFAGDNYSYSVPPTSRWVRGLFAFPNTPVPQLARGFALAIVTAVITTRIGLAFGDWMRRVRR